MSGIAAEPDISTQDSVTRMKPSRGLSSRRNARVASARPIPSPPCPAPAITKSMTAPSCTASDQAMGSRYNSPKKAIMSPSRWATANKSASPRSTSAAARPGEQPLDLLDVAAIRQEHDHVVVVGDLRVVMRDHHRIPTHHRADARALGQRDLTDLAADDARGLVGAVDHGL